jgi:hypothetical protein
MDKQLVYNACTDTFWKAIKGFEGKYEISNKGVIRSLDRYVNNGVGTQSLIKGKVLVLREGTSGYLGTVLYDNGRRLNIELHRQLALTFIPNTDNLEQVNHIDGDKLNNELNNLEWLSQKDNVRHAFRLGLNNTPRGDVHKSSKLNSKAVGIIKRELNHGLSQQNLATRFGVHQSTIWRIANGLSWSEVPESPPAQLVYNGCRTPDGTLLVSTHRHDYVTHTDKNGEVYMRDGGQDYIRCSINVEKAEELSLTLEDDHSKVRDVVTWGTYGIDGDQPLKYISVGEMETAHIIVVLDLANIAPWRRQVLETELRNRDA